MAHYLVTGGCGFIGSHLVNALEKSGDRVTVLDDLSTGRRENVSGSTKVVVGTITDPSIIQALLKDIDGVFHLAAIASVERSRTEWRQTHAVNLTGFVNILDGIVGLPAPIPVVYASSAAVYGNAPQAPVLETVPARPMTAYGADKLGCELHARVGAEVHRIPSTGLRFFNVYGPRQDPRSPYSGVISIFCDRLHRGKPIEIHGDGGQTRDFIYVTDVVEFLLAAMRTTSAGARVFNVCTGAGTSVLELAGTIAELCKAQLEINFKPLRAGDIRVSLGSASLASESLRLEARVPVRQGLAQTLEWMAQAHDADVDA
jgi:UDP-glucose 4-epimerase